MSGARGGAADRTPGEFRRTQNWIGGSSPSNARFVRPPVEQGQAALYQWAIASHADDDLPTAMTATGKGGWPGSSTVSPLPPRRPRARCASSSTSVSATGSTSRSSANAPQTPTASTTTGPRAPGHRSRNRSRRALAGRVMPGCCGETAVSSPHANEVDLPLPCENRLLDASRRRFS